MKYLCSLVLALGLTVAVATPAQAAGGPLVTGVVETPAAVFFQPSQFPNVVWYFPKTEVTMTVVPPQVPGGTFWRAAVVFKAITDADLALLPPEWAGKSFVPYIIRPTTECKLNRQPEMRFVVQEVKALNRDVSSANPPACRFSFRLPTIIPPDLQARLDALMSTDSLIARELILQVRSDAAIAWADVHAAVAAVLEELPPAVGPAALTPAEARAAVESALASPALEVVSSAMTPAEALAFVDATIAKLFTTTTTGSATELHFVTAAPTGTVVYHQELFQRAM